MPIPRAHHGPPVTATGEYYVEEVPAASASEAVPQRRKEGKIDGLDYYGWSVADPSPLCTIVLELSNYITPLFRVVNIYCCWHRPRAPCVCALKLYQVYSEVPEPCVVHLQVRAATEQ